MTEDQAFAHELLESVAARIEDAGQLRQLGARGDYAAFQERAAAILRSLQALSSRTDKDIPLPSLQTIIDSLERIMMHAKTRSAGTIDKIDYEFLPFLKDLYNAYYFYNCVYPDKRLMEEYYQRDMVRLGANRYLDEAVETGRYKYDLSVSVLAFNKLEYTRLCVESLLAHIPQGINYELILINNGSTDGTKEFFESMAPTKQLDILINGHCLGAATRIIEGRYYLDVSNDVIVTENAIANMIRCMESDDRIAWVVPTTPNVTNLQTIPADYKSIPEMHEFAKKNNHSDPRRWEQRVRLCNPISLRRSYVAFSSHGVHWPSYFRPDMQYAYTDDKEALFYRRNGYKMMLAKDAYCYHFGSVTIKGEVIKANKEEAPLHATARVAFHDAFGIDPWGTGHLWSPELMALLPCREQGPVTIVGVNCGIGSNPLKIRESLKEKAGNFATTLYNATDDQRYVEDLRGLSDGFALLGHCADACNAFPGVRFDYIVFESGLERCPKPLEVVRGLEKRMAPEGFMAFHTADGELQKALCAGYPAAMRAEGWCVVPLQHGAAESCGAFAEAAAKGALPHHDGVEAGNGAACAGEETAPEPPDGLSSGAPQGSEEEKPRTNRECPLPAGTAGEAGEVGRGATVEKEIAKTLHGQALALHELGKTDLAIRQMLLALEVDGVQGEAHNDIAILYYLKGDGETAVRHLGQALKSDPDNLIYKKNMADVCLQTGRVEEALSYYQEILEAQPDNVPVLMAVADLCANTGMKEDARSLWKRVLAIEPENESAKDHLLKGVPSTGGGILHRVPLRH